MPNAGRECESRDLFWTWRVGVVALARRFQTSVVFLRLAVKSNLWIQLLVLPKHVSPGSSRNVVAFELAAGKRGPTGPLPPHHGGLAFWAAFLCHAVHVARGRVRWALRSCNCRILPPEGAAAVSAQQTTLLGSECAAFDLSLGSQLCNACHMQLRHKPLACLGVRGTVFA